jgi:hypothetical protein
MRGYQRARSPKRLDDMVRLRLGRWPQRPPGAVANAKQPGTWLRGRPCEDSAVGMPFLKLPGTNKYRTIPDGLWLHFSPDPADRWADILCIEACGTVANLQDKRARFAPSTSSLLVVCPVAWLNEPVEAGDPTPRWRTIRMLREEPSENLVLPVRDVRVLYGLKPRIYDGFLRSQMPQPHEYFCPMDVLTDEYGHEDPALAALIARASATSNFMTPP